jgi:cysteinyl-tRNA synthetase, unknown class
LRVLVSLLLLCAAVAAAAGLLLPLPRLPLSAREGPALTSARTWGYQLQNVAVLALSPALDMVVVDASHDGRRAATMPGEQVAGLQQRQGAPRRIVLCYLSIGEAESYRYYWQPAWDTVPPRWLGPENKDWKGNYAVRYWDTDWQRILLAPRPRVIGRIATALGLRPEPYIDRILEAGYDGVVLDKVDGYGDWPEAARARAEADMVSLVSRISRYAKAHRPGFLVVVQNGEELLRRADYRKVIDGVAKEDLLYGVGGDEVPNPADGIAWSATLLDEARTDGKPVFVVEYLSDPTKRAAAAETLRAKGYVPFFARRDLGAPPEPVGVPAKAP